MVALKATHRVLEDAQRDEIGMERQMRISAQRGLVPYVRAVEALNKWLKARPALTKQLQPIMQELELWDVKLGYDPDKDLTLSVLSPNRRR
jgi:hypothetical protein